MVKRSSDSIETLLMQIIEEYKSNPIDLVNIDDTDGEQQYIAQMLPTYRRTIVHVSDYLASSPARSRNHPPVILEIGSFLGVVSIALKYLGFDVTSQDIPEFQKNPRLQQLYHKHDIQYKAVNLRSGKLPYDTETFDCVIMCEVIEHLNFNPLPCLLEINRVLKQDGLLYLTLPNLTRLDNRIKLLKGHSIHNSPQDFFKQLDRHDNMIVGLHWREYTKDEILSMLEAMGFFVYRHLYQDYTITQRKYMRILKTLLTPLVGSLKEQQIIFAIKREFPTVEFYMTEANS